MGYTVRLVLGLLLILAAAVALGVAIAYILTPFTEQGYLECRSIFQITINQPSANSIAYTGADCGRFFDTQTAGYQRYGIAAFVAGVVGLFLLPTGSKKRAAAAVPTSLPAQPSAPTFVAGPPVAPAAWYPAEGFPGLERYWNGSIWTDEYRPAQ